MSQNKIRPASTIVLLKEVVNLPPRLFMVQRHHQIDTASGALVFPGGKIETQDNPELFSLPAYNFKNELLPFAIGCIRELFEETGVLFARKQGSRDLLTANELLILEHYRQKLIEERVSFSQMCMTENIELAVDQLLHFAHWITPSMAPKRFDTHFFVAKIPEDQIALHDGDEAVDSIWKNAKQLLEEANQGRWKVVFPTRMNLEKLARFNSFSEIESYLQTNQVVSVEPEFTEKETGKFMCIPKEADYPQWEVPIEKILTP